MPINYAQVTMAMKAYAQQCRLQEDLHGKTRQALLLSFDKASRQQDALLANIEEAEARKRRLYSCKPTQESISASFPLPALPAQYSMTGADGSQIQPSRHRALQFCVINVGLIRVRYGSNQIPTFITQSSLLDEDKLFTAEGYLIGEDEVALHRDLSERRSLLEHAGDEDAMQLALTDGPLDVFFSNTLDEQKRREVQESTLDLERQLLERGICHAGYIDKPGSKLISSMLALFEASLAGHEYRDGQKEELCAAVSDASLLSTFLTRSGDRSAIFKLISKNNDDESEHIPVAFFYLNVAGEGEPPCLARIELPQWLLDKPQSVDLLHACIYREARILDTHPYPYVLHRAHELAVISRAETDEVERMLLQEFSADSPLLYEQRSNKDYWKGQK